MRKIVRRGGLITMFAAALSALLAGCDDECSAGKSECQKGNVIRTCVQLEDGNEWVYNQCGSNEVCRDADAILGDSGVAADSGVKASTNALLSEDEIASVTAACVGACTAGEAQCLGASTSRFCVGNGAWQIVPCNLGEECIEATGVCTVSSGPNAVQRCKPDAKACASDKVEKVCNPDGTAWTELPCAANETCTDTECLPDPESSCDDMNTCIDSKTLAQCLAGGKGFELITCPGKTWCEGGLCQGKACALGKFCSGPNQVRECTDGESFEDTQCAANEICQQQKNDAECVPVQCTVGTTVCGDPRDAKVDPTTGFTTCALNPTGSGVPEWASGECTGTTTCNPDPDGLPFTPTPTTPCTQDCTPGSVRCAAAFAATGVSNGTQTCNKNGKWGAIETCNPGSDTQQVCVTPIALPGELTKAVCTDPSCGFALSNPLLATGICEDGKLRACLSDGTLAKSVACDPGICQDTFGAGVFADGRTPGLCNTTPVCKETETQCVGGSLFQTCVNGRWSTALSSCAKDALCSNVLDANNLKKTVCGGDCLPGSRSCDPLALPANKAKIYTCSADGKLDKGVACDLGVCTQIGSDATCNLQCVPGSFACTDGTGALGAFSNTIASDGFHAGWSHELLCGSDGTWKAPEACGAGTACLKSGLGKSLGCVQCVGEDVAGGNSNGRADTRCDPAATADKLQTCNASNKWASSVACAGDTSCAGPAGTTCGTCTAADNQFGNSGTCTETFVKQVCGSCNVMTGGGPVSIPHCTESAIAGVGGATSTTCLGQSFGAAGVWGGYTDCCLNSRASGASTCGTVFQGTAVSTGDEDDCCSEQVQASPSFSSFAACYPPP